MRSTYGRHGDADLEPSLGAPEPPMPDQLTYVAGRFCTSSQEHWSEGLGYEQEDDPAEDGIADMDGIAEQLGYHWSFG